MIRTGKGMQERNRDRSNHHYFYFTLHNLMLFIMIRMLYCFFYQKRNAYA